MKFIIHSSVIFSILELSIGFRGCEFGRSSDDTVEGPCIAVPAQADPSAWQFLFTTPGTWNIVMAHTSFYRKYVEVLLDCPGTNCHQIGEMNLKAWFENEQLVLSGFDRQIYHNCVPSQFQKPPLDPAVLLLLTCAAASGSNGTDISTFGKRAYKESTETVFILWTDQTNTIVFGKCLNGNRVFSVWSRTTSLDVSTLSIVKTQLNNAGYNSAYYQYESNSCLPTNLPPILKPSNLI